MSFFPISGRPYNEGVNKLKVKIDPSLKKPSRRGRPKKGHIRKDTGLHNTMRIPPDLIDIAKSECKRNERLGDTILRIIREKSEQINILRQEINEIRNQATNQQ